MVARRSKILVTGCGRTGTQYMAGVLQTLGLRCTHERIYRNHPPPWSAEDFEEVSHAWRDTDVEVSWLAAPRLDTLPPDTVVWHQLREPLKTLRCWVSCRMTRPDQAAGHFIRHYFPICSGNNDLNQSAWYMYLWNWLIERTVPVLQIGNYLRYRIEDMTATALVELLAASGWTFDLPTVAAAMEANPTTAGTCHHTDAENITWDQVYRCGVSGLRDMFVRYGYPCQPA